MRRPNAFPGLVQWRESWQSTGKLRGGVSLAASQRTEVSFVATAPLPAVAKACLSLSKGQRAFAVLPKGCTAPYLRCLYNKPSLDEFR
jgi:hypothetical protein